MSDRALDYLALDALDDRTAPPVLRLAAWRYIYRGKREPLVSLLLAAAQSLGLRPRYDSAADPNGEQSGGWWHDPTTGEPSPDGRAPHEEEERCEES